MSEGNAQLIEEFGKDCRPVIKYLRDAGYFITPYWRWSKPKNRQPTEKELRAIDYLTKVWDFGGLGE